MFSDDYITLFILYYNSTKTQFNSLPSVCWLQNQTKFNLCRTNKDQKWWDLHKIKEKAFEIFLWNLLYVKGRLCLLNWLQIWILNKLNSGFTFGTCPDRSKLLTADTRTYLPIQNVSHLKIFFPFWKLTCRISFFKMTHQKLIICGWLIEGLKIARKWWLTIGKPPSRSRTKAAPNPFWEKIIFLHNKNFDAFQFQTKIEMRNDISR